MNNAQIRCGVLRRDADKKGFFGSVQLIGRLDGDLILKPHELAKRTDDSPDYEVYYRDKAGSLYGIGSAWLKNNSRVDGGDFLTMTLTHPDWPADLSLAAFPSPDNTFRIVWSRPRGANIAAAA